MKWICPNCNATLEPVKDYVDIGVGIQEHVTGAACPVCGNQYAACNGCGRLDFETHAEWCDHKD